MKTTSFRGGIALAFALAASFAVAGPAAADIKPGTGGGDEDEEEKVPEGQGSGSDMAPGATQRENPLPKIVELIRAVEGRLVESDTSEWTRAEQERIVRALEDQGEIVKLLEDLIKLAESQPPSGGGGGGGDDSQGEPSDGSGSQGGKRKAGQPRPRGGEDGRQPVNPQAGDREKKGQGKERNDATSRNDKKGEESRANDPYSLESARRTARGQQWGTLPPRVRRALLDADAGHKPEAWRERIEEYLKKINEKSASPGN